MTYCPERAIADTEEPAIKTAKILQKIANYIKKCIQLTYHTPESNDSEQMPVLDLEVLVGGNTVRHGFYKKDISNEFTIMSKSAPRVTLFS